MPAFVPALQTTSLHAPFMENWESIVIKAKMSLADEEWIANHYTGMGVDEKGTPAFQASLGSVKTKTLERMIISWSLTENGTPVPVTPENISRLDTTYANYIYEQINAANQPMEAKAQEDFTSVASVPTEAEVVS